MIPKAYALLALEEAEVLHDKARALQQAAALPGLEPEVATARMEAGTELLRRVAKVCFEARKIYNDEQFDFLRETTVKLVQEVKTYHETKSYPKPAPVPSPSQESVYTLGDHYDDQDWQATEARKWYEEAAREGHVRAKLRLAVIHAEGRGGVQDSAKARALLQEAASAGSGVAKFLIGRMWLLGQGCTPNLFQADAWCEKSAPEVRAEAEAGDVDAQLALAWMMLRGVGLYKDAPGAVALYRRAAEGGSLAAQTELGLLYAQGLGVEADRHEAVHWLLRAAEQGYAPAQAHYGELLEPSFPGAAREWYEKAGAQGHPLALHRLGALRQAGEPRAAFDLWMRALAASSGPLRMRILCDLGDCYGKGQGVGQDGAMAVKHWRESAEMGHTIAAFRLARYYDHVAGDAHEAVQWYAMAARAGHAASATFLGDLCREGRGTPRDLAEAERWYAMAVEKGDAAAAQKLEEVRKERAG